MLIDYLDIRILKELQDSFSRAAGVPVILCGHAGDPLACDAQGREPPPAPPERTVEEPIVHDNEVIGRLSAVLPPAEPAEQTLPDLQRETLRRALKLMADVVGRLVRGEGELRDRVSQLTTLFTLSAEFAGQRSLQGVLDLVAQTVVKALKAKACSIRLLSEDRKELVIKAVANLSAEYLNKGPILVSASRIDQQVLSTGAPLYIADESADPRILYPKEAQREGIVSALCAPLTFKGRPEGVIRVYTGTHHEFNWFEISLLQAIATQAAGAIVTDRLRREADSAANLRRHMKTAAVVQRRMTPPEPTHFPQLEFGSIYVPCFDLAGDFYDYISLPGDNLGLVVCDVVGKGVRASLLMASIRASLRAHASNIYAMESVLDRVNRDLCAVALESDFATMFYAVIDAASGRMTYSTAGHPPALLFREGELCHLASGGPMIGIAPGMHWRHQHFTLKPGDVIVAYTDGLSEALNFADEAFGAERIESAARAAIDMNYDARGIARHVLWEMRRFAGLQTRFDDVTAIVVRVKEPLPSADRSPS